MTSIDQVSFIYGELLTVFNSCAYMCDVQFPHICAYLMCHIFTTMNATVLISYFYLKLCWFPAHKVCYSRIKNTYRFQITRRCRGDL